MAFKDNYDFDQLVNEAERLVIDELEKQVSNYPEPLCLCEDCVLDMATLALNSVKPLYRVSLLGSIYAAHAMDEVSYAESVKNAVASAIAKVKAHPSHD
uniref:Competence protein ComFB n=1 Tax=Gracilinema caldarium TaxID=215591 RepID=A0A7C3ILJ2_9SPIR